MLPRAQINVTPMMDVMLVVLMIFMFIMPAIVAVVNLPVAAHADPRPVQDDEIVLRIDRDGRYTLETSDVWQESRFVATPDELRRRLGRLYGQRTKDRVLFLKADTDLPFGTIERAIDIARASGVRVVGAVTERVVEQGRQ
jgi:biopolymer transport protein ExbD